MKRITFLLIFPLLIFFGCTPSESADNTPSTESKESQALQHIEELMQQQQNAWNQGNIEAYMQAAYLQSDSLMFIGSRGLSYGYSTVLNNYVKAYPNTKAMGRLQFENKDVRLLGSKAASVTGKWTLYRETDTLSGHYLLVWQYINGRWVITQDHSS